MKPYLLLSALAISLFVGSCSKEDDSLPVDTDAQEARDFALADAYAEEAEQLISDALETGSLGKQTGVLACATVTVDTTVNPRTVVIDFGPVNCLGNDGRYRRGRILGSFDFPRWQVNAQVQSTYDDYFVNNRELFGQRTSVLTSLANNQPTHTLTAQGGLVGLSGDTALYSTNRVRVWTQGYGTPGTADDVREISGTSSAQRPNGTVWAMATQSPLVHEWGCPHFSEGVVLMTATNRPNRLLDYGNTGCDNQATVTVNGYTWAVTLP
ncbi:hypothetical protein GC167_04280 [bacterium]|nr:hypothetical protein [bacterium]